MNLHSRVNKLESACTDVDDLHIMITVIDVSGIEPIGYRCEDGTEIIRQANEPAEVFKSRCFKSVDWPSGNSQLIFEPIYKPC